MSAPKDHHSEDGPSFRDGATLRQIMKRRFEREVLLPISLHGQEKYVWLCACVCIVSRSDRKSV